MSIRVLLVEDHRMVREALCEVLRRLPDIVVVGEAGDAQAALEQVRTLSPDVVVLDVRLPDLNGIELAARLKESGSAARILALSAYTDPRVVTEMLRAGAAAYVTKCAAIGDLVSAIRAVAIGQGFLSADIAAAVMSAAGGQAAPGAAAPLARREREVLRLLADGARSAEIARQLQVSVATIEVHRRNIMRKLGLRTVAELTKHAIREGIVSL